MNAKFDMCGDVGYLEPPLRFEAGTQNIEGIMGLKAAIDYIMGIGLDNINAYEEELKSVCRERNLKRRTTSSFITPRAKPGLSPSISRTFLPRMPRPI
jgi:cysteine desulfurase/selenocysteine lyase